MVGAIIVSGGRGKRMGSEIPKQYLKLDGQPVLIHTLRVFDEADGIDTIVLVLAREEWEAFRSLPYTFRKMIHLAEGGVERQDSVRNGLDRLAETGKHGIVFVHDGARPLITKEIISDGLSCYKAHGDCACGVIPKDTIKVRGTDGYASRTLDRKALFAVQTPQIFGFDALREAHRKLSEEGILVTDDTMVIERYGGKVYLYEGSYENIKITTKDDLIVAENILKARREGESENT
jgi:2-C-methyl-D-erythritol 4-phosphate cytidylyltransferase